MKQNKCQWCGSAEIYEAGYSPLCVETLYKCRDCHGEEWIETTPEPVVWECQCRECGAWILTDEHTGGAPYFGSCQECGGQGEIDDWQVSDEPHPALWGIGGKS